MERFGDIAEREIAHKQLLLQEAKELEERKERREEERERRAEKRVEEAQQRAEDAHTMQVDLSKFTPNKRGYWERKQQKIINMQLQKDLSDPNHPQAPPPPEGPSLDMTNYVPLHDTHWIPSNDDSGQF